MLDAEDEPAPAKPQVQQAVGMQKNHPQGREVGLIISRHGGDHQAREAGITANAKSRCFASARSRQYGLRRSLKSAALAARGQQAFALSALAGQLACATNGFSLFASSLLGRLLVVIAEFHLTENALALHLLLERLESLFDVVITYENLHECCLC
jgi:hypothetical protein